MRILLNMPGLFGDVLNALPTVRAVAEHYDQPVSLWISHHYQTLAPLIEEQDYIEHCFTDQWNLAATGPVYTLERFEAYDAGPWRAPVPAPGGPWDGIADLQYRGWPQPTVLEETARNAEEDLKLAPGTLKPTLDRPWIRTGHVAEHRGLVGNWRREDGSKGEFIDRLVRAGGVYLAAPDEPFIPAGVETVRAAWQDSAAVIRECDRFVCCQSAPWVLANALHHPRIETLEPDVRRHDRTFWLGTPGNRRVGWESLP